MSKPSTKGWPELAIEGSMLGAEMATVIWLRSIRMMGGGKLAEREASRMVTEKLSAGMGFFPAMMAGGIDQSAEELTSRALAFYGKPVRSNRRRLSRNN